MIIFAIAVIIAVIFAVAFTAAALNIIFAQNPFMGASGMAVFQANAFLGFIAILAIGVIFLVALVIGFILVSRFLFGQGASKKMTKKSFNGIFGKKGRKSIYV